MPDQYSYLIGKRYEKEKLNSTDNHPTFENSATSKGNNCPFNSNPPDNTDDISPTAPTTHKTAADIATQIGVSEKTVRRDAEFAKAVDQEAQQKKKIYDLWLACETQTSIEEITGIPQRNVSDIIANFTGSSKITETGKFRDFEQDGSALRIYDIYRYHAHLYPFIF